MVSQRTHVHICITHGHRQQCGEGWRGWAGWRGAKRGKCGTSVIVSIMKEGKKEGRKEASFAMTQVFLPPGETHQGMLTTNTSFEKFIAPSRGPKALSASSFSGQNGTNLTFD